MTTRLVLVVAAAIFRADGRVLMAQRPEGKSMAGLWEFPGGKVEKGEAPEAALCRELYEELQITVDPETLRPISFATFNYESFHLLMPLYEVTDWVGEPKALEGQSLDWVRIQDLKNYPAPPADIPLFEELARRY